MVNVIINFNKKYIGIVFLLLYSPVSFSSQEATWDHMGGYIIGVGKSYGNFSNGAVLNAHFVAFIPSLSLEYIDGTNNIKNGYFGVGFTNLIQFQIGKGNEGVVKRIRSDIFITSLIPSHKKQFSFPLMYPKRQNIKWYDRVALTLSVSKYDANIDYQYQIGIGATI